MLMSVLLPASSNVCDYSINPLGIFVLLTFALMLPNVQYTMFCVSIDIFSTALCLSTSCG